MKKKKFTTKIFAIWVVLVAFITPIAFSVYQNNFTKSGDLEMADPIFRMKNITQTTQIEDLKSGIYYHDFKIANYDENNDVSSVNLSFQLAIKASKDISGLDFQLYLLENNEIVRKIELDNDRRSFENFEFSKNLNRH